MYTKLKVSKPTDNSGRGSDIIGIANVFDWSDVTGGYERDSKGVVIPGTLVFEAGAFIQQIEFTKSTLKNTSSGEGDPDKKGILQGCEFDFPGNEKELREFRSYWLNKSIGIIYDHCDSTKDSDLYGTPCAPLEMTFSHEESKDSNATKFTFKSTNKGPDVAIYQGSKTFDTANNVDADATSIDVADGEGNYQLADGSASAVEITTCTNAEQDKIYTLLGSGGTNPSTVPTGNDFILASGATWTAISGAMLTFRAYKDGAATWKFIEISRS